jgi:hypothetical protein
VKEAAWLAVAVLTAYVMNFTAQCMPWFLFGSAVCCLSAALLRSAFAQAMVNKQQQVLGSAGKHLKASLITAQLAMPKESTIQRLLQLCPAVHVTCEPPQDSHANSAALCLQGLPLWW